MDGTANGGDAALPPWKKVLYVAQPYPDNYVDKTFLESVLTSTTTQPLDLFTLAKDSSVVAQQVSTVAVYCIVYLHVYYERISARVLIGLASLLLLGGWVLRRNLLRERPTLAMVRSDARQLILLVGWLLCISPVLATLTRTFSDDTICALTLTLFAAHLAMHDYQYALNYSPNFRGSISMNAALLASVLLAARLPSTPHVFAVMLLATMAFVLLPAQWHRVAAARSAEARAGIGALAVLLTAAMLTLTVSNLLAAVYLLGIATISGLGPWLLVSQQHAQKDAVRISGPWDSAVRAFLLTQAEGRRGDHGGT